MFFSIFSLSSQCNNKNATRVRNECNDKLKSLLSQCLNGTEIEAFNKIEDIASRLYEVICRIDQDEMKSMKQFIFLVHLKEVIGLLATISLFFLIHHSGCQFRNC
jgi:hypothetical protein